MVDDIKKVVLITGCSSGIGKKLSEVLKKDYKVYSTSRKSNSKNIIKMDVTKDKEIHEVINEIIKKEKRIDILINNASYGHYGSLETLTNKQVKDMFNTNFFGTVRVIKKIIPIMKKQKIGKIINISSVAGIIGSRYISIYSASKFAIEGLSESLYEELKQFGIAVKIVNFGFTKDTNFGKNIIKGKKQVKFKDYVRYHKERKSIPINKIIKIIISAIEDDSNRFRYISDKNTKKRLSKKIDISKVPKYLE